MASVAFQGISLQLPPHLPRARPRWWEARGGLRQGRLGLDVLHELDAPPAVTGIAGLAFPCSLPRPFLEFLDIVGSRKEELRALAARTPSRLFHDARAFASRTPRGRKQPRRTADESESALERRRLARFAASLPLLRRTATPPWDEADPPYGFEVDPPALLKALDLPATGLTGSSAGAIEQRARILAALAEGRLGAPLDLAGRDLAVASPGALEAVCAACAAAWVDASGTKPPPGPVEAWIPLP